MEHTSLEDERRMDEHLKANEDARAEELAEIIVDTSLEDERRMDEHLKANERARTGT